MDIEVLRYFKMAAQLGSMSKAAKELHLTQPALTHAIQRLERELKVLLFERSKKGLSLTASGLQALRRAEQLIQDWSALKQEAAALTHEIRGSVRLGVHPSVACYFLPTFLPRLLKEHPLVELQLHHDLSRRIMEKVVTHQLDVGLVVNPTKHPEVVMKELLQDEVVVWKRKGAHLSDTLIYEPHLLQTQWTLRELNKQKNHYPRNLESSNLEVIQSLLTAGAGHAILPSRVARLSPCELERAYPAMRTFRDTLYLVYRPSFRKTALGKTFLGGIAKAEATKSPNS